MAKKGGSFWDNPFGGLFDFNRDGKEGFFEQMIAFKLFEECTREEKEPDDSSDDAYGSFFDGYDDLDTAVDTAWRDTCEDGSEYGLDPEDYETEDEYNEALEEARTAWHDTGEDGGEWH